MSPGGILETSTATTVANASAMIDAGLGRLLVSYRQARRDPTAPKRDQRSHQGGPKKYADQPE